MGGFSQTFVCLLCNLYDNNNHSVLKCDFAASPTQMGFDTARIQENWALGFERNIKMDKNAIDQQGNRFFTKEIQTLIAIE